MLPLVLERAPDEATKAAFTELTHDTLGSRQPAIGNWEVLSKLFAPSFGMVGTITGMVALFRDMDTSIEHLAGPARDQPAMRGGCCPMPTSSRTCSSSSRCCSQPPRSPVQDAADHRGHQRDRQPESLSSIQQINARIEAEGLTELVSTDLTDEGLKAELRPRVRLRQRPSARAGIVLNGMLETLAPFSGRYDFAVEGHTDSTPVLAGGTYASNWELSTARANAVRSLLAGSGVEEGRVRVEGYADTVPLLEAELEGLTEEERLARHRRVIVRIY